MHKVLTVLPGVARLKRFELLPPAFVELGRSGVGTFRTLRDVRVESVMRSQPEAEGQEQLGGLSARVDSLQGSNAAAPPNPPQSAKRGRGQ